MDRRKSRASLPTDRPLYIRHSRKSAAAALETTPKVPAERIAEWKQRLPHNALPPAALITESERASWYARAAILTRSGYPHGLANVEDSGDWKVTHEAKR